MRQAPRALLLLSLLFLILLGSFAAGLLYLRPVSSGIQTTITNAFRFADQKHVKSATFYAFDSRADLDVDGTTYAVAFIDSAADGVQLETKLTAQGVPVSVLPQTGKRIVSDLIEFLLPLLILANLFGIFMLLARGGASQVKELLSFGRVSGARARTAQGAAGFARVGALEEAVRELQDVVDYLKDPRHFVAVGALPPKGVLLYGPPGTGKTLLARALAGEAGVPFLFISASEFVESLVGIGAARVRDLFRQARACAPCIVFVDELDAAGRKRGAGVGGGQDEREQTLNEILVQMDGFAPTSGVVVVGATNRPDILDPALLRPGRFDRHVAVEVPDLRGRIAILHLHAEGKPMSPEVYLETIARRTPGFTGADLANLLNEAAILAARAHSPRIEQADLEEAIDRLTSGPRRKGQILARGEVELLAAHEAGHAVVGLHSVFRTVPEKVTIVPRGRSLGQTESLLRGDRRFMLQGQLEDEIMITLAGRAAEILVRGQPSTAGEDDVERASELARNYVARYGMSETLGPLRVIGKDSEVFLGRDYLAAQHVSANTLQIVDEAIRSVLRNAEQRAGEMLRKHRSTFDALSSALVREETVQGMALREALGVTEAAG